MFGWIAGAAALLGGAYLFNLNKLGNRAITEKKITAQIIEKDPILKLIPTKINLQVDVLIKNPTNVSANIRNPFVSIFLTKEEAESKDAKPFASSSIINGNETIPPYGQLQLKTINLPISLLDAALKAPDIIANAKKTKKLGVYIQVQSFIDNIIKLDKPEFKEISL